MSLQTFDFRTARVNVHLEKVAENRVVRERKVDFLGESLDVRDKSFVEFAGRVIVQGEAEGNEFDVFRTLFLCEAHNVQNGHNAVADVVVHAVAGKTDFHHGE
ncbi:MAG: hypothetical protein E7579_07980 [Ruminococcaceae bacterium]|nr:hypothetical protein [Oscillospiraceae bacterium]